MVRTVGGPDRLVHLVALPVSEPLSVVSALCGALLIPGQVQTVERGTGVPCSMCLIHRVAGQPVTVPEGLTPGGAMPLARRATPLGYAALEWPVTVRGDQVLLALGIEMVALVMPTPLAEQAVVLLASRARPAPVLSYPDMPGRRIVLAAEPFGVELPWPAQVSTTTGQLPLPPTRTPAGPVTWAHLPDGHALGFCREIDLFSAVRSLTQPVPEKPCT